MRQLTLKRQSDLLKKSEDAILSDEEHADENWELLRGIRRALGSRKVLTARRQDDLLSRSFCVLVESDDASRHQKLLQELHAILTPGSRGRSREYYAKFFGGIPKVKPASGKARA